MNFIDNFTDMMPHEIVIHKKGAYTKAGDVLPGASITVKCYVDGKSQKVVDDNKQEVTTSAVAYCHTWLGELEPEATVDLPVGFHPRLKLKVVKIDPLHDELSQQGSVLYLK
jgi:hypothetical protein